MGEEGSSGIHFKGININPMRIEDWILKSCKDKDTLTVLILSNDHFAIENKRLNQFYIGNDHPDDGKGEK